MRQKDKQKGTVLIIAMVCVVMLTLFSMSLVTLSLQNAKNETAQESNDASMLLAHSGVGAGVAYMALKDAPVLAVDQETDYIEERFANLNTTGVIAPQEGGNPGYKYKIKYKGNYYYQITSQSICFPERTVETVYEIKPPNLDGLKSAFQLNTKPNANIDCPVDGVTLNFGGTNATLDGRDYDLDGNIDGSKPAVSGAAKNDTDPDISLNDTSGGSQMYGTPPIDNSTTDLSAQIDTIVNSVKNNHDWQRTLSGGNENIGHGDAADGGDTIDFGSIDNPCVGYFRTTASGGTLKLVHDDVEGYGILVIDVDYAGTSSFGLSYSGQFKWTGLIIMHVRGDYDPGNQEAIASTGGGSDETHIRGALIMNVRGDNVDLSGKGAIKVTGSAGSGIQYSSAAIAKALSALDGKTINFKFLKKVD